MRHAAGAAERLEWLNIRDELEGLKKSAVEAREYKLVTSLQHQLQSHNLTSNCQQISIRHYNSLGPRRNELLALLENKRAELSVSKHVLELQEIGRLTRALRDVNIFENFMQGMLYCKLICVGIDVILISHTGFRVNSGRLNNDSVALHSQHMLSASFTPLTYVPPSRFRDDVATNTKGAGEIELHAGTVRLETPSVYTPQNLVTEHPCKLTADVRDNYFAFDNLY